MFNVNDLQVDATKDTGAKVLFIWLPGGVADLIGNGQHIDEIKANRLSQIPYGNRINPTTPNQFWSEAGGNILEELVSGGKTTVFRSVMRDDVVGKAHLLSQKSVSYGTPSYGTSNGFTETMIRALELSGALNTNIDAFANTGVGAKVFVNDSQGFNEPLKTELGNVTFDGNLSNPFTFKGGFYANGVEATIGAIANASNEAFNSDSHITEYLKTYKDLGAFVNSVDGVDLGNVERPSGVIESIVSGLKLLLGNESGRVTTVPYGVWDDHSDAMNLTPARATGLFTTIKYCMDVLEALGRNDVLIYMVSEFGRNMSINSANGFDHGSNMCSYWFGGSDFINHKGVVGSTTINTNERYRIFTQPVEVDEHHSPFCEAATLYELVGITNPEDFTEGYSTIDKNAISKGIRGWSNFLK